ncbi:MAG: fumarate reductase subunit FrdD [Candidatus Accumulibacter sp.]|jgi:fumarate reductase subunit D|nr:fumarate reductase subunit FrdD [Accumulibacter sp.]
MTKNRKRSNAPVFWLLFGAGGMLAALTGPMLIFITGIAIPLGLLFPEDTMSYPKMLGFAQNFFGKGFIFVIIALFLWHSVHRIFHSLHEFGIPAGPTSKLVCYGTALAGTLVSAFVLFRMGF